MICKVCGKNNLDDAKFCSSCGASLIEKEEVVEEEFKICKSCGAANVKAAKFCKTCGSLLQDVNNNCPSCGLENKPEAMFCKSCGTPLKKKPRKNIGRLVFNIISLCICSFILLYCFAATFTSFLVTSGYDSTISNIFEQTNLNLFQVIDNLSNMNDNVLVQNLGAYGKVAYIIPNVIMLLGIGTAMVGCTVMLILAIVRSTQSGLKRELPNLECYATWTTGFLLAGLMVTSLNHLSMDVVFTNEQIYVGLHYGSVVLSALCIGIIWMFACHIAEFVFRCVEELNVSLIRNKIFHLVENIFIVILVFNIAISFARISINQSDTRAIIYLSSGQYFNYAYVVAGMLKYFNRPLSSDLIQSLIMSPILLVFMIAFIVFGVIFFIRRGVEKKEDTPKSSLCCGIVFMALSIGFLTLSCVTAPLLFKDTSFADIIGASVTGNIFDTSITANVIVTVVFASALLALEIVWTVLESKKQVLNTAENNLE